YIDDTQFNAPKVLAPHISPDYLGGTRAYKAAEKRLQSIGLMPAGSYMVPASWVLADGKLTDAYGNVRGPFIRTLLSYFAAFTEAGYGGNMGRDKKAKLARRGRSPAGYARINGVEYFISLGRGRRGPNGAVQHLAAGIWQRTGTHGSAIKPVFHFTRTPRYVQRWRFHDIADSIAQREFPINLERRHRALAAR
ncbi:MAG: hypothetical protein ACRCUC_07140, partial [Aestuariivirga sp.]